MFCRDRPVEYCALTSLPFITAAFWPAPPAEVGSVPVGVAGRRVAPLPNRAGGERSRLGFARAFGRFGFIGRQDRWPSGLSGQEPDRQECPYRGNTAGDEAADGEAAQECVGGGEVQRLPEGRVAEAGDGARGRIGRADGLVGDRRDLSRDAGGHGGGEV